MTVPLICQKCGKEYEVAFGKWENKSFCKECYEKGISVESSQNEAIKLTDTEDIPNQKENDAGDVGYKIEFPGSKSGLDRELRIFLDGELIGSGFFGRGFHLTGNTTTGMHKLHIEGPGRNAFHELLSFKAQGEYSISLSYSMVFGNFKCNVRAENQAEGQIREGDAGELMPWDTKPLAGLRLAWIRLGILSLFGILICAGGGVFILPIVFLSVEEKGQKIVFAAIWFVILTISIFAIIFLIRLYTRLNLSNLERQCGSSPIYHLRASIFQSFSGMGNLEFLEDRIKIEGLLGPDLLPALFAIIAFDVLAIILLSSVGVGIFIGFWGIVIVLGLYDRFGRKDQSVFVPLKNIGPVTCEGPILSIKFKAPSLAQLKGIRVFVSSVYRRKVFGEVDRMLPNSLPIQYREALHHSKSRSGEEESHSGK